MGVREKVWVDMGVRQRGYECKKERLGLVLVLGRGKVWVRLLRRGWGGSGCYRDGSVVLSVREMVGVGLGVTGRLWVGLGVKQVSPSQIISPDKYPRMKLPFHQTWEGQ